MGIILDGLDFEFDNLVVIHQENKGFSGARNDGLKQIYGKYVSFVDSDDTLKLLDDYFNYEKENQQAVYDFTLQQIKMNTMRINTLHDEKANKANFVISMKVLQQYFPTFNTNGKDY